MKCLNINEWREADAGLTNAQHPTSPMELWNDAGNYHAINE
jgi:hypothetical protein